MRIGPAQSERADASAARRVARSDLPLTEAVVDEEWRVRKIDFRVGPLEVQAWRQLTVLQRKNCFDQPRNARGGVEMPDICLDRTDGTPWALFRAAAEHLVQGGYLDTVAQRRTSAMRFDVRHAFRWDVRQP